MCYLLVGPIKCSSPGHGVQDYDLPTTQHHCKAMQAELASTIKAEFSTKFKSHKKLLHWDDKVTQFLDAQGLVYQDCNAFVLRVPLFGDKPHFTGAPVEERETGRLLADSALHCVDEWEARNSIIATVFEPTSANTVFMRVQQCTLRSMLLWSTPVGTI